VCVCVCVCVCVQERACHARRCSCKHGTGEVNGSTALWLRGPSPHPSDAALNQHQPTLRCRASRHASKLLRG